MPEEISQSPRASKQRTGRGMEFWLVCPGAAKPQTISYQRIGTRISPPPPSAQPGSCSFMKLQNIEVRNTTIWRFASAGLLICNTGNACSVLRFARMRGLRSSSIIDTEPPSLDFSCCGRCKLPPPFASAKKPPHPTTPLC